MEFDVVSDGEADVSVVHDLPRRCDLRSDAAIDAEVRQESVAGAGVLARDERWRQQKVKVFGISFAVADCDRLGSGTARGCGRAGRHRRG